MADGYTRQSAAEIVDGATVEANPLNAEFNSVQSAMNAVSGHNHDGTAGGGAPINLVNSTTGTLTVSKGGTGATTFATNGVLYGNGTSAIQVTTAGSDGEPLISVSGTPTFQALDLENVAAVTGQLGITNGGTGGSSASTARTNLGLSTMAAASSSLDALRAPTTSDNSVAGFVPGSVWINSATDTAYMLTSENASAEATWKQITV